MAWEDGTGFNRLQTGRKREIQSYWDRKKVSGMVGNITGSKGRKRV